MVDGDGMAEKPGWGDEALEFECPFEDFGLDLLCRVRCQRCMSIGLTRSYPFLTQEWNHGKKKREDQSAPLKYGGPGGRQRGARHSLISGQQDEGMEAVLANAEVWKDGQGVYHSRRHRPRAKWADMIDSV